MELALFLFAFADLPLAMAGVGEVVLGTILGGLPIQVGTDFCGARGIALGALRVHPAGGPVVLSAGFPTAAFCPGP